MRKIIIFALVAISFATACQNEDISMPVNKGVKVYASIKPITKITYTEEGGALKQAWAVGDNIVGFDEDGNSLELKIASGDDIENGVATFTLVSGSSELTNGKKVYLIYAPGKHYGDVSTSTLSYDFSKQSSDVIPALMTATGTVNGGTLDLSFENKMAIIGMKNPTVKSSKGTQIDSISLYASNVYTHVNFGVSDGNLVMTPSDVDTIKKACSFTPSATDGTTSATVYFAVFPNESAADLKFFTPAKKDSITVSDKSFAASKYYYFTPNFPNLKSSIFEENDLDFELAKNSSHTINSILKITSADNNKSTYSNKNMGLTNGAPSFTFKIDDNKSKIVKIEILFTGSYSNNASGWTANSSTDPKSLSWTSTTQQGAESVTYSKHIQGITQIKVTYNDQN